MAEKAERVIEDFDKYMDKWKDGIFSIVDKNG